MNKHELILDFCKQFRSLGAENCFSNGMCYWFARILEDRFAHEGTTIVYSEIPNHFGCRICDKIYDITGEVTNKYNWQDWNLLPWTDLLLAKRVLRDCVYKFPSHLTFCGTCPHSLYTGQDNFICTKDNHPVQYNQPCDLKGE
jgi:hypothetical protein